MIRILILLALCVSGFAQGTIAPIVVSDPATLVKLNPSVLKMALLTNGLGIFRYDIASAAATNTADTFAPTNGIGRWILVQYASSGGGGDKVATNNGTAYKLIIGDATASKVAVIGPAQNITNSTVTLQELLYIAGLTAGVQSQLDAKLAATNGAVNNLTIAGTTTNRLAVINYLGALTNSPVPPTEIWVYGTSLSPATGVPSDGLSDDVALLNANTTANQIRFTPGTWNINTNFTITKDVIVDAGALIKCASGVVLKITKGFSAPEQQVFDTSAGGVPLFTKLSGGVNQARVRYVSALWFGIGNGNGSNDQTLFDRLAASVESGASADIYLPAGIYNATNTIHVLSGQHWRGASPNSAATQITFTPVGHNLPAFGVETSAQDFGFHDIYIRAATGTTWTNISGIQLSNSTTRGFIQGVRFGGQNGAAIRTLGNNLYLTIQDCVAIQLYNDAMHGNALTPAIFFDSTNVLGQCTLRNNHITTCDKAIWIHGNPDGVNGFNSFTLEGGNIENCGQTGPNDFTVELDNGADATFIGPHFEANQASATVLIKNARSFAQVGGILASDFSGTIYSTNSVMFDNVRAGAFVGSTFNNTANMYVIVTNSPAVPTYISMDACAFDLGGTNRITGAQVLARVTPGYVYIGTDRFRGTGAPNFPADVGSIYAQQDGTAQTALWFKATGTNSSGWLTLANFTTGLGLTNISGVLSNNIVAGSNIAITAGANGQLSIASTASGGTSVLVNDVSVSNPDFKDSSTATITSTGTTNLFINPTNIANAQISPSAAIAFSKLASTPALASRSIATGAGLTGGGDLSADRTLLWDASTFVNNLTLWDASQATRTWTANLSGATDPVWTFGNNSADLTTGVLKYGGNTVATSASNLGFFAATTSAQLAGIISDETGTGALVFAGSPTFTGTVTMANLSIAGQIITPAVVLTSTNIDLSLASFFIHTNAANEAFTFSNPQAGSFQIWMVNPSTYTVAWPSTIDWKGSPPPTQSLTNTDIYTFTYYPTTGRYAGFWAPGAGQYGTADQLYATVTSGGATEWRTPTAGLNTTITSATGIITIGGTSTLASYQATDATTTSASLANLGTLSCTLVAGKKYSFTAIFFISDSTSVDGAVIDFNGGTATATTFRAQFTSFDTALNLSSQISALSSSGSMSTFTGNGMVEVHGAITVNAGGTFKPRFSQAAHTTGTLTCYTGSNLIFQEITN